MKSRQSAPNPASAPQKLKAKPMKYILQRSPIMPHKSGTSISPSTITALTFGVLFGLLPLQRASAFSIDGGSDYAILFEGGGNNTLQVTNVTVNGNIGVGGTGKMSDSGPSTVGRIDFSAANGSPSQFSSNNGANVLTGPNFNVAAVTTALTNLNALNTALGGENGTDVAVNGNATINASAGALFGSDRVFDVTSFNAGNDKTLTINGDGVHDVVLNFTQSTNFSCQVVLNNISAGQVLYNFVGGSNLTGGPTLQVNDNGDAAHPNNLVQGIFLDPNGAISVTNTRLLGRVFGGDSHDTQIVSGDTINLPIPEASTNALLILGIAIGMAGAAFRGKKKA